MINHISIGVHNPEKTANVLAELWDGIVLPFPPSPDSFIVLANDGKGSAVEVTPIDVVLEPGTGLPEDDGFSTETITEENEARFVRTDFRPQYVSTHLNINTKLSVDEVKAIGKREGWRTLVANRDKGLFQLVELWIEDRFMLEVMTPEQTQRYVEITSPEFIAKFFAENSMVPAAQAEIAGSLSLIG
ncbi:MAG: hypothetical protein H7070_06640 [Saprospiraceae bacterium]|nr:hypothetical protein [Pyrinomonadaceae bacterium]